MSATRDRAATLSAIAIDLELLDDTIAIDDVIERVVSAAEDAVDDALAVAREGMQYRRASVVAKLLAVIADDLRERAQSRAAG